MPGGIFISYRRDDTSAEARNIRQHLSRAFRRRRIFIDVEAIPKGRDFLVVLEQDLKQSEVMLAVIGPSWLTVTNETGEPRLSAPDDVVRLEIATALARDIAVIPVLVRGARMPKAAELPDDLKPLARRNGSIITHENFPRDMDGLVQDMRGLLSPRRSWVRLAPAAAAAAVVVAVVLLQLLRPETLPWRSTPGDFRRPGARLSLPLNRSLTIEEERRLDAGDTFAECKECPQMIVVPAGQFRMGSPDAEAGHDRAEGPVQTVTIERSFAVSVAEVTVDQYAAYVSATGREPEDGCMQRGPDGIVPRPGTFRDPGYEVSGLHPVACVSWYDAKAYVEWLAQKTGKPYRLMSEAEWEYAARAHSTMPYWFGDDKNHLCAHGNVADLALGDYLPGWEIAPCNDKHKFASEVRQFARNAFGLYDVMGNLWEWTADCWRGNLEGTSPVGVAFETDNCSQRALRGGSWASDPRDARSAARTGVDAKRRSHLNGIRVGAPS